MSDQPPSIGRSSPMPAPCKVCGGPSPLFGVIDFNRSCEEVRGHVLPLSGLPVYYRRCGTCGLLFTDAFDDWSVSDFQAHIYNGGYVEVDPDYAEVRPAAMARTLIKLLGDHARDVDVLDYGGGNGRLAQDLREGGFSAVTYDPFTPEFRSKPTRPFALVTCIETLEHSPNPRDMAADLAALMAPGGMIMFSTLVQPPQIEKLGMGWWYIGPRNGHVSLFSHNALQHLWAGLGLQFGSFSSNLHVAFRTVPTFAEHLWRKA